jgi:hypothetical protein
MFAVWEMNGMEGEMCFYLKWQLNVDPSTLRDFQNGVQLNFVGPGGDPLHGSCAAGTCSFYTLKLRECQCCNYMRGMVSLSGARARELWIRLLSGTSGAQSYCITYG